jgi:tetratricopeptide (TPR) repeat protein
LVTHDKKLAQKLLEKSVLQDSENQYAYYLLGRVNFVLGNFFQSELSFKKSIALDPEHEQSYYGLGLTYGYMGKAYYTSAADNFKKYIELANQKASSGKVIPGRWAGYNDLAWIYFQMGEVDKCSEAALAGLKLVENPWLNNMAGICLMNEGKYPEAKVHLERALGGMNLVTGESFGQAYTGDDPRWYLTGRNSMEKTIEENLELINKKLLTDKK